MTAVYEAMFLLDNAVVREDWKKAKAVVTDALEKHGAVVKTARRWDERKLAYMIKSKNRGTYMMCYYEMGNESIAAMRRELDLNERVLRYLILRADEVPAQELELSQGENAADFVVPAPPPDDLVEPDTGPIGVAPDENEEVMVPDLDDVGGDMGGDSRPRPKRPDAAQKPQGEV